MARIEGLDSRPHSPTRRTRSYGGHIRRLPQVNPSINELSKIPPNGNDTLNSDTTEEEAREYLGVSEPRAHGRSRNSR